MELLAYLRLVIATCWLFTLSILFVTTDQAIRPANKMLKYYHTGFPDRAGTVPTPKYGKSGKKSWPSRQGRGMIGVSRGMFVRIGNGATTV